jgi:hypothetical protein
MDTFTLARLCGWAFALLVALVNSVCATPIAISFTAAQFSPVIGSDPAPADPVSGTLVYEAASTISPIDSLTSISLSIAGHSYGLAEIGFEYASGIFTVGGLIDGVGGSGNFEDDFVLIWDNTLTPLYFQYSVVGLPGIWATSTFSQLNVTESSNVPEPSTLALVGMAILLCAFTRFEKSGVPQRS